MYSGGISRIRLLAMIQGAALAGMGRIGATPTVDKYFLAPFAGRVSRAPFRTGGAAGGGAGKPLRKLGPHLFAAGSRAVLLRHCTERELAVLQGGLFPPERVHYVLDDDPWAMAADPAVPDGYRRRMRAWTRDILPEILKVCGHVIAPSRAILDAFPDHEGHLLGPCMLGKRRSFAHFGDESRFHLLYAGTASHAEDIAMIAPVLADFCAAHRDVRLVTFLGGGAPEVLKKGKNIRHFRPMRWPAFRMFMARASFHAAVAPMRQTPVNRARSFNKVLDHALMGAAGLYSARACPAIDEAVDDGEDGLLIGDDPGAWREMLENLYKNRTLAASLARKGAERAGRIGDPRRTRAFWTRHMELER